VRRVRESGELEQGLQRVDHPLSPPGVPQVPLRLPVLCTPRQFSLGSRSWALGP
jgi:hypothetical protein